MKSMKKLVAALLVLTMVLALTGTAMAACKFEKYDHVKFTKNTYAYKDHRDSKKSDTIVRKGSIAMVACTYGDKWVKLYLNWNDDTKTGWFKVDNLKKVTDPAKYMTKIYANKVLVFETPIYVIYSNAGVGGSDVLKGYENIPDAGEFVHVVDGVAYGTRISDDCYKHVKATSKVWMHKKPCLKYNYGKALRKNDKVTYRRCYAFDNRYVGFYGIKYKGKCLWVSCEYSKLVK